MTTQETRTPRVRMPGLTTSVSALALGTAGIMSEDLRDPLYDAFFADGGNLFDTAWIYGNGTSETVFGEWLSRRGVRSEVVIIGKGAHTPHCTPRAIGTQLTESLERMRIERVDLYMMHRDDVQVPVDEFVDAIGREIESGRIGAYGFSNWTLERVDAASRYARGADIALPAAVSNNFSLADMVEPVWEGCLSARHPTWRERLAVGDLGLYAWSSQARGFFTDRAGPDKKDDAELVRCWYSAGNFARRQRAIELGERRGANGNQIALAYCIAQDLPLVPLIGPLTPAELADSMAAAQLALTAEECRWLEGAERA